MKFAAALSSSSTTTPSGNKVTIEEYGVPRKRSSKKHKKTHKKHHRLPNDADEETIKAPARSTVNAETSTAFDDMSVQLNKFTESASHMAEETAVDILNSIEDIVLPMIEDAADTLFDTIGADNMVDTTFIDEQYHADELSPPAVPGMMKKPRFVEVTTYRQNRPLQKAREVSIQLDKMKTTPKSKPRERSKPATPNIPPLSKQRIVLL